MDDDDPSTISCTDIRSKIPSFVAGFGAPFPLVRHIMALVLVMYCRLLLLLFWMIRL